MHPPRRASGPFLPSLPTSRRGLGTGSRSAVTTERSSASAQNQGRRPGGSGGTGTASAPCQRRSLLGLQTGEGPGLQRADPPAGPSPFRVKLRAPGRVALALRGGTCPRCLPARLRLISRGNAVLFLFVCCRKSRPKKGTTKPTTKR